MQYLSAHGSWLSECIDRDQSVETSPELELNYAKRRIESKLRDEMAEVFAIEIKSIEENFKIEVQELEKQSSSLRAELQRTKYELQVRQNEVEVLKHAILAEKEKNAGNFASKRFRTKSCS